MDGKIDHTTWVIDGQAVIGDIVNCSFKKAGNYNITVTISDNDNSTVSRTMTISVGNAKTNVDNNRYWVILVLAVTGIVAWVGWDRYRRARIREEEIPGIIETPEK
jgi:hypothetical protein